MSDKYGTSGRAALLVLMLENREVPNTELVAQHKIKLGPKERAALNEDGLLETAMDARPYRHRITDKGIDWCATDIVETELPPRSGPRARAHRELLRRVVPFLQSHGLLAQAIRSGALESLIRAVYLDLADGPQDWIRLARIRPGLNGATKSEVDEALVKMLKTGTVHLAPDSNRKVLTEADHEAAIRIGNEDLHLIAIEES
ncbi:hypothetical protein [Umezawaea sp. NPDC059074]|uniref:hypothetical protein n=1 Tax=Umezawaea sp. NPDC059074 TaxID=3346716 RepID=UPI003693B897